MNDTPRSKAGRAATDEYKILALSGGGARGIFQAAFLKRLEADMDSPLGHSFDLVAATSIGGVIALALANGREAHSIYAAFRDHAKEIFDRRMFWLFRSGARYDARKLRKLVEDMLGTVRMSDLGLDVLICASGLDTFEGRIFTRQDRDLPLVDVAMATSAAPTYFAPVVPRPHEGGYVDGGLWANDPSHLAASYAVHTLGIMPEAIKLLSLGTGRVTRGRNVGAIDQMRLMSADMFRFVLDISADLQAWHSATLTEQMLGPDRVIRINPELPKWIRLDDASTALDVLPGLADTTYDRHRGAIAAWRDAPVSVRPQGSDLPDELLRGLRAGGITRFMPSRDYYSSFRQNRESISAYVAQANCALSMVSINLATGVDLEKIMDTFLKMICHRSDPVRIRISLLNPENTSLMQSIAPVLRMTPEKLSIRINDAIGDLTSFANDDLPRDARQYFCLSCHNALPQASAIMIDEATSAGVIQLESKPYRSAFKDSFAWEIRYGTEFYQTIRESYSRLIADGEPRLGNPW